MTVYGASSRVSVLPTTSAVPPSSDCQNAWVTSATRPEPRGSMSLSWSRRPRAAPTPRARKSPGVASPARTPTDSPSRRVRNDAPRPSPMASRVVDAAAQSAAFGGVTGMHPVCSCSSHSHTSRSDSGRSSGRRRMLSTTPKMAVLVPIPMPSTKMAAAVNPGARAIWRSAKRRSILSRSMAVPCRECLCGSAGAAVERGNGGAGAVTPP